MTPRGSPGTSDTSSWPSGSTSARRRGARPRPPQSQSHGEARARHGSRAPGRPGWLPRRRQETCSAYEWSSQQPGGVRPFETQSRALVRQIAEHREVVEIKPGPDRYSPRACKPRSTVRPASRQRRRCGPAPAGPREAPAPPTRATANRTTAAGARAGRPRRSARPRLRSRGATGCARPPAAGSRSSSGRDATRGRQRARPATRIGRSLRHTALGMRDQVQFVDQTRHPRVPDRITCPPESCAPT